jgi:hypothetical protein
MYEGSSVLLNGVVNREIHRNVATAQFGGGIDVRTRPKLLFPICLRGEVRDFYTLRRPASAFRLSAHSSIMSLSREDWLSLLAGFGEDAMLDSLADHERQCQHGS